MIKILITFALLISALVTQAQYPLYTVRELLQVDSSLRDIRIGSYLHKYTGTTSSLKGLQLDTLFSTIAYLYPKECDDPKIMLPPSGFSYQPPFDVMEGGGISPHFDLRDYTNLNIGSDTVYVDVNTGNNANDGSTWLLAKQSVSNAITATTAQTILIAKGRYYDNMSFNGSIPSRNIEFIGDLTQGIGDSVYITSDLSNTLGVWGLVSNHYEATLSTSPTEIWDMTNLDVYGDGTRLTQVASSALVNTTINSWYFNAGILYLRTFDSRAPDLDIYVSDNLTPQVRFRNNYTHYLANLNFRFCSISCDNLATTTNFNVYIEDCNQIGGTLSIDGVNEYLIKDFVIRNHTGDLINIDPNNSVIPMGSEVNVKAYNVTVDLSGNASTGHNGVQSVIVDGYYGYTSGSVIAYVNGASVWIINTTARNGVPSNYLIGTGASNSFMFLDDCVSISPTVDDIEASTNGTAYIRNFTGGATNSGTIITDYPISECEYSIPTHRINDLDAFVKERIPQTSSGISSVLTSSPLQGDGLLGTEITVTNDAIDYTHISDTPTFDANLSTSQSTFTNTTTYAGTTGTGSTYSANSLTSGKGIVVGSSSTGLLSGGSLFEVSATGVNGNQEFVAARVAISDATSNITGLQVDFSGADNSRVVRFNDSGVSDTSPFAIDATGKVGIGVLSPTEEVEIENNQNASTRLDVRNTTAGTAATSEIRVGTDQGIGLGFKMIHYSSLYSGSGIANANRSILFGSGTSGFYLSADNAAGVLGFNTGGNLNNQTRMYIDASGNIAFGFGGGGTRKFSFREVTALTNTVSYPNVFEHQTTGVSAIGFGTGIEFTGENASAGLVTYAQTNYTMTNATSGAVSTDFILNLSDASTVAERFRVTSGGKIVLPSTITTPGTTGDQVINKPSGTVNIAAAGTSVVVTNSLVTTSSLIFPTIRTNDTTAKSAVIVPSSGSFTIYLNAAATAEVSIGFLIIN